MLVRLWLLLLVVGVFVVGARLQPAASVGLLAIPETLYRKHAIEAGELAAAQAAARRMASWRRRGVLIGALLLAVPVLVARNSLPLGLVAILAGAAGGLAAAQWWQTARPGEAVRSAGLERRTVVGLVGVTPLVLPALGLVVALAATVGWLVERSHTGHKVLVVPLPSGAGKLMCEFTLSTPALSGPAIGWAATLFATLVAVAASRATVRRGVDTALAPAADRAFREAGIRTALGGAIAVTASCAAGMLFMWSSLLDASASGPVRCGSTTAWDTARSDLLAVAALVFIIIAMTGLLSYVLFPGRIRAAEKKLVRG